MEDFKFLFDTQLIAELESLIKNAKHKLLLISPFIDLDNRIQEALNEHKSKHDFELLVLFGKNEDNYYKSIKKGSLDFFKEFPNIEIRYNERLHAKFYQNDYDYIMTSLNLYDFSLAKNIEAGIKVNYASKGLIGKAINSTDTVLMQGVDKVKQGVFGMGKDIDPIEKFQTIFESSDLKYKTEPIIGEKDGFKGALGGKKLNGFTVKIDKLLTTAKEIKHHIADPVNSPKRIIITENISSGSNKTQSASQLSKMLGVSLVEISNLMQKAGLINGDQITSTGLKRGLVKKNYNGKDYISYPENLLEFKDLKKY